MLASLFAVSVLVLALSVRPICSPNAVRTAHRFDPPPSAGTDTGRPARVECARPAALRLRRFEDGSAWLLCGERILARVSTPR